MKDRSLKSLSVRFAEASIWPDVNDVKGITEHQREGLANATKGKRSGSCLDRLELERPGLLPAWLKRCQNSWPEEHLHWCATGKAAVRVTENLANRGIPIRARTWHSFYSARSISTRYGSVMKHR